MTNKQINEYNANLLKWKLKHKEQEQRRIEALKRGENAQYGYFKDSFKPPPEEQNKGDDDTTPNSNHLSYYKLELTYKQANEAIKEGAQTINLIVIIGRDYIQTNKNALLIPKFRIIKDINENFCLFTGNKFLRIF